MRRRAFLRTAALAVALPPLVARAQSREITLAAVVPHTGPAGPWGQRTWNGMRLACDLVNSEGGVKALAGARLTCVVADTESKPEVAGAHAERLIARGASAVVGCNQSAASIVVSEIAERARVPFVTPTDLEPEIIRPDHTFTFRTVATVAAHARDVLRYVRELGQRAGKPPRRLAIVSVRSVVGNTATEGARRAAAELGYEIVEACIHDPSSGSSIADGPRRYRRLGVEVVVGHLGLQDAIGLTRAMVGARFDPRAYAGILGAAASEAYARALGPLAEDVLGTVAWSSGVDMPGLAALGRRYRERFGEELEAAAAAGITAVAVLWDALERAGSTDGPALRTALAATDLRVGERMLLQIRGVKFLPGGENGRAGGLVLAVKRGVPLPVAPREYARAAASYPKPPWARS